jgi:hypothetical protein
MSLLLPDTINFDIFLTRKLAMDHLQTDTILYGRTLIRESEIIPFRALPGKTYPNKIMLLRDKISDFETSDDHFSDTFFVSNSSFLIDANIRQSVFAKTVAFYQTTFGSEVSFHRTSVFQNVYFGSEVSFRFSYFESGVSFNNCFFMGDADFNYTTFQHFVNFSNIHLGPNTHLNFQFSYLPDTIDLSSIRDLQQDINLTDANLSFRDMKIHGAKIMKPILICLYNTDISKIRIDYNHFKLWLPDTVIDPSGPRGAPSIKSVDDKEAVYESLLNNFKSRGQSESYQLLDIEYQRFKYDEHWYTRPLSVINRCWWNYGYSKGLVFLWAAIFIVFFTGVNFFFIDFLNDHVYTMENLPKPADRTTMLSKLWASLVYTSGVFFRLTLKVENLMYTKRFATAYVIFIYTIGIVCLAYMANFVLQK